MKQTDLKEMKAKEDREITLLKACRDLLQKQVDSDYVLHLLDETIFYDNAECDGDCLLDDIRAHLSEVF